MATPKTRNWREKPPGPEQRELERLFYENVINYNTTQAEVQKMHPVFKQFTEKIFSAHFRRTRAILGLCVAAPSVPPLRPRTEESDNIPELGDSAATTSSFTSLQQKPIQITDIIDICDSIDVQNPPFCMWMYSDHKRKNDFVCVVLPIFSGTTNLKFDLSEDGTSLRICYTWPKEIFKAEELFKEAFENKEITEDHPKVHAFVTNLENSNITQLSQPQGFFTIQLICKVKREIGSWVKRPMKINDTKLIMLEFTAYQKALLVNDADTSLTFE